MKDGKYLRDKTQLLHFRGMKKVWMLFGPFCQEIFLLADLVLDLSHGDDGLGLNGLGKLLPQSWESARIIVLEQSN